MPCCTQRRREASPALPVEPGSAVRLLPRRYALVNSVRSDAVRIPAITVTQLVTPTASTPLVSTFLETRLSMTSRFVRLIAAGAAITVAPTIVSAQQAPSTPPVVTPALDFSGVVFGSYSYRTDSAAKAGLGGQNPNQFSVDRAYLTFRMPAGNNGAIRITTDVFQNTNTAQNAYYQGWAVRIKYAYLQDTGFKDAFGVGSSLLGRIGILHTVVIDHEEGFWPRYLQQTAIEKNGFFSSADAGVAAQLTLGSTPSTPVGAATGTQRPNTWGEIYGTITNGPGYASYEKDRFKDFALRATFTPLTNETSLSPIIRSFTISPWYYKGQVGSNFATGGTGQVGPGTNGAIVDGLTRDRYGIFAGIKERRLTAGAEFAQRKDESETGGNTAASPRVVHDSTGRVIDGFAIARPVEWFDASQRSPFSIVARWDHFTPNTSPTSANYVGTTPAYDYYLLGASYDLTQRMTLTFDYQNQSPTDFPTPTGTNVRPTPQQTTIFLHFNVAF